ncbi:MAG: hypothetical protein J6I98_01835, partial [Clostridia bacterium]|nr:hypothetical protein [Clostridia bacterium]
LLYAWQQLSARPKLQKPLLSTSLRGISVSITAADACLITFLLLHLILFCVFYPVLTGTLTTQNYANALEWLPTWYFA